MTWLPIGSAPKDGSLLLLQVPGINGARRHSQPDWPDVTLVTVLWAFALVVWGIVLSDLTRNRTSKQCLPHPIP